MRIALTIVFVLIAIVAIVVGIISAIGEESVDSIHEGGKRPLIDRPFIPTLYVIFIILGLVVAGIWEN
jgi:hypothetical protein